MSAWIQSHWFLVLALWFVFEFDFVFFWVVVCLMTCGCQSQHALVGVPGPVEEEEDYFTSCTWEKGQLEEAKRSLDVCINQAPAPEPSLPIERQENANDPIPEN